MKKITSIIFSMILIAMFAAVFQAYAENEGTNYTVVTHKDVPVSSVSLKFLKRVYLKDVTSWEGGGSVTPVDLDADNSLREAFSKNVLGKGVEEMRIYWINQKLTRNLSSPASFKNSQILKKFISQNPGAIGYIKSTDLDDSVKPLRVEP